MGSHPQVGQFTSLSALPIEVTYQEFEDTGLFMELGSHTVQQLHLVLTWNAQSIDK